MTNTENSHKNTENAGYEKSDVNVAKVIIFGIFGIIILVAVLIFTWDYFTSVKESMVENVVLKPQSAAIRELHARETEELNSYKLLDADKGVYRIPIERAMELVADEAYRERQGKNR
jgi:hypothetical protein